MSRTRQKPNEMSLWLFKLTTTDTDGEIENSHNSIGIKFNAEDMGMKSKNERDVLSGRVLQSGTVEVYKTSNQINLAIGDNIATKPNATELEQSTIVNIKSKPQNQRGARHNTNRVYEYTFEVS